MKTKVTLIKPLWYQTPIIDALSDTQHKYITACLSRRIGKSIVAKNMAVKWALSSVCTIGYITPTGDLSRKFIRELCTKLNGSGAIKNSSIVDKYIQFTNGSIMYFMSAESGDSNRGNGYKYLIYDEAAFIGEDVYMSVFKPMELQASKVLSISTPNGAKGFFYERFSYGNDKTDKHKRYISYMCTLEECGLYDKDTIQEIKDSSTRMVYQQEYMCVFVNGGISCFGDIDKMVLKSEAEQNTKLFAGIDFSGDGSDETVLTIVNSKYEMVLQKCYKIGNSESIDDMSEILNRYKVFFCYAESNSMGAISIDYMKKNFKKVEGYATTNESKREYVENVICNFEHNIGGIIDNDNTKLQFNSFVMKYTPTKKITYSNISDNIHDDRVISYCLACLACKNKGHVGVYCINN